jgi:hypothetical protein
LLVVVSNPFSSSLFLRRDGTDRRYLFDGFALLSHVRLPEDIHPFRVSESGITYMLQIRFAHMLPAERMQRVVDVERALYGERGHILRIGLGFSPPTHTVRAGHRIEGCPQMHVYPWACLEDSARLMPPAKMLAALAATHGGSLLPRVRDALLGDAQVVHRWPRAANDLFARLMTGLPPADGPDDVCSREKGFGMGGITRRVGRMASGI